MEDARRTSRRNTDVSSFFGGVFAAMILRRQQNSFSYLSALVHEIQMKRRARLQSAIAPALVDVEVPSEHTEWVAQQTLIRDGLSLTYSHFNFPLF